MSHTLREELEEKVVGRIHNEPAVLLTTKKKTSTEKNRWVQNNNWIKKNGATLYECMCFLKNTEGKLATEFAKNRAETEKEITELKKEAEKRKVNWQRILDSAFIARIKSCPIPNPEKPSTVDVSIKEIHSIVDYLTTHLHHCKKNGGPREVSMYRWASYDDRVKIDHSIKKIGRPPIGCRLFEGRWLYPNNDPLTHGKTKYQEAVEVTFGNLLGKYNPQIKKVNEMEVRKIKNNTTNDLKCVLKEKCGQYLLENRNGRGALLVRGFYKEFCDNKVFFIVLVRAVGEYRRLQEVEGFRVSCRYIQNGFTPKNTFDYSRTKVSVFIKIINTALKKYIK